MTAETTAPTNDALLPDLGGGSSPASHPARDEAQEKDKDLITDHATLKYSLLGPSLTKAGQDAVDQSKVTMHRLSNKLSAHVELISVSPS